MWVHVLSNFFFKAMWVLFFRLGRYVSTLIFYGCLVWILIKIYWLWGGSIYFFSMGGGVFK